MSPYIKDPLVPHTTLYAATKNTLGVCMNKEWLALQKDGAGNIEIPTGKQIAIRSYLYDVEFTGGSTITTSCSPLISFLPQQGKKYVVTNDISDKYCGINVAERISENDYKEVTQLDPSSINCK